MKLTQGEQKAVLRILKTFTLYKKSVKRFRLISIRNLESLIAHDDRQILRRLLELDPRAYGWKGKKLMSTSKSLALVPLREFVGENDGMHFLPTHAFKRFQAMNLALKKDIHATLYVESGYRSDGYQLVVFLDALADNAFNIKKTCRRVALPGWSEHGAPFHQAIDFTTENAAMTRNTILFARTKEYRWLVKNATKFGFELSYPRGNKEGVIFEPWHWRFSRIAGKK